MGLPGLAPVGSNAQIGKSASTGMLPPGPSSVSSAKSMRFMTTTRSMMESPFDDRNRASVDSLAIFTGLQDSMKQTRISSMDLGEPALTLAHPCRVLPKQLSRLPKMRAPVPTPAFDTENRMAQRDVLDADYSILSTEKEKAKSLKLGLSRSQVDLNNGVNTLLAWKKRDEYASAPKKYTTSVPVPAMKDSGPMWFNETERTYETEGNIIHAVKKDAPPADNVSAEDIKALKLIGAMTRQGFQPNVVTYTAMISACDTGA